MVEPKTVSNLPLDVSIRWAKDQELLTQTQPITQDADSIAKHAVSDVNQPTSQSQIEILLGLYTRNPTWAAFQMPKGFITQKRRLFTSQLVGFLGSDEQQDTLVARIQGATGQEEDKDAWSLEKDLLLQVLKLMNMLNKDLIDIVSRCKQYQKG
ncbi:MAG TPA: DUF5399 family protein [Rhabdochlamydiaceae bacterium]|nr:DUF5399 family protein [Rhabdochlamydiaceae bacterium]